MAAEKIGPARCPLCGGTASVSLSKSQLTVMTMNCCQAQLFTRSDRSDSLVRAMLLPRDTPASEKRPDVPDRGVRIVDDVAVQTDEHVAPVRPEPTKSRSPFSMFGA